MFSSTRKRLTYANVTATLALVFAMSGGAYAAGKYLITSTKQIKPSVLKQLQGKPGTNGPAGTTGAAGATGAQGPAGATGPTGPAGANGENGAPGTSATTTLFNGVKGGCVAGGAEVKSASPTVNVCNGKEGSPWTAGGTLPAGKSETGTWSTLYTAAAAGDPMSSAISFSIPLQAKPEAHYIGTNQELAGEANESPAIKEGKCSGTPSEPVAASGNLCVFASTEANSTEYFFHNFVHLHLLFTSARGTAVMVAAIEAGEVLAGGTWVVTE